MEIKDDKLRKINNNLVSAVGDIGSMAQDITESMANLMPGGQEPLIEKLDDLEGLADDLSLYCSQAKARIGKMELKSDDNKEHRRVSASHRKQEADGEGKGHWTCPACQAEGDDEVIVCPVCGTEVVLQATKESKKTEETKPAPQKFIKDPKTRTESILGKSFKVQLNG